MRSECHPKRLPPRGNSGTSEKLSASGPPTADAAEMSSELWKGEILGEDGELALGSSRFKSVDHEKQGDRRIGKTGGRKIG